MYTSVRLSARAFSFWAALLACASVSPAAEIRVDADFPGGNITVERLDGDTVYVAPDLRDTQRGQWWFYWNFRLRAPAGQRVKIVFSKQNPLGVRGPAVSTDRGVTWRWLGAKAVTSSTVEGKPAWSFTASVPEGADEIRYSFCPQYLASHLQTWLAQQQGHVQSTPPALRVEELCRSRKSRAVELLRAGCLDGAKRPGVVLLTSRHHCCETMGTYALEGFLSAVLADDDVGRRWRSKWEVIAVPFVDKDGSEDGDQGKNRTPHDHNRDYNERPLYPEVAAITKLGESLRGRVVATMDLHCPWIRGEWNDRAYFVGPPQERFWKQQLAYAAILEREQQGPIHFHAKDCLAFGTAWNTASNFSAGKSNAAWAREVFPDARLVASLELAYADALGAEVTADSARAFGRDLARALEQFLASDAPR